MAIPMYNGSVPFVYTLELVIVQHIGLCHTSPLRPKNNFPLIGKKHESNIDGISLEICLLNMAAVV